MSQVPAGLTANRTLVSKLTAERSILTMTAERSILAMTAERSIQEESSMGRFSRSWDLVERVFRFCGGQAADAVPCVIRNQLHDRDAAAGRRRTGNLLPALREAGITAQNFQHSGKSAEFMAAMFVFYLANYFVIVFFNVALVGVANSR